MLTKSECKNALKEIVLSYDAEYVNECNDEFCQAMKKKIKLLEDLIDEHFPKTLSDEMFEKLGYTKMESYDKCSESYCLVQNVDEYEHHFGITFNKKSQCYHHWYYGYEGNKAYHEMNVSIDMELHKAVHQKCLELGWLDDQY